MKRGPDTNVLVSAHMASLPEHGVVRGYFEGQLVRRDVTLVLTPAVLHEFVHVVTDPRRFDPPVAMGEALALARLYLGKANVECRATDAEAMARRSTWWIVTSSGASVWPIPCSPPRCSDTASGSS